MDNTILKTDSYKFSHWKQYPPKTQYVRSYLEPRGGVYKRVMTYGALQVFIRELFGQPITRWMVDEAEEYVTEHMGPGIFNRKGWEHILREHDGFIPLRIRAVPEGLFVPVGNALLTVENSDPAVPWLTNYFETAMYPWYPYTVATLSNHCRQIILKSLEQTGDPALIDTRLHDFGYRGTTDPFVGWQAAVGGLAHLVNFKGTDNVPALWAARRYYGGLTGAGGLPPIAGISIPAAEHSTITSWGREHELDAYRNMLEQFPTGYMAVVSDSYDIYNACEKIWGETLRDQVTGRDGVLVIRPDSGNPPEVVRKCLEILGHKFGKTPNQKGYRVLHPKVRLIQGDGVDPASIDQILAVMGINGWSADNIAFGMGGALLQKVNRDTMRFAFKCMSVVIDGVEHDVWKDPITDKGKRSKAGNLTLVGTLDGRYATARRGSVMTAEWSDVMRTVYDTGRMFNVETHETIWNRARSGDYENAA